MTSDEIQIAIWIVPLPLLFWAGGVCKAGKALVATLTLAILLVLGVELT